MAHSPNNNGTDYDDFTAILVNAHMLKTFRLRSGRADIWLRIGQRTLRVALGLGVGMSLWSLGRSLHPAPATVQVPIVPVATQARALDLATTGRMFGTPLPQAAVAAVAASDAMKLVGIIVSDDPGSSIALFDANGVETSVTVGGTLPDGETLKSVSPLSVILARGSEERMLEWEMREAPTDAAFGILPVGEGELIAAASPAPIAAKAAPPTPAAVQLMELRQAAIQVLSKRASEHPSPSGSRTPPPSN